MQPHDEDKGEERVIEIPDTPLEDEVPEEII